MDMAENQQGWLTYDGSKDCSHGICTVYCPQWCYVLLPPPPAFSLSGADEDDSGTSFSPLVIAIIGILASALVLVSYYTFISKYCTFFSFHRRYLNRHHPSPDEEQHGGDRSLFHEGLPPNGLDEAQINKITVCRYKRGEGPVEGTDCSVCLAEFREEDDLRLLPKCSHAFHLQCIDTWLRAHSNCPLCRANIVSAAPAITDLESVTSA